MKSRVRAVHAMKSRVRASVSDSLVID
jgi:hypothetical protein